MDFIEYIEVEKGRSIRTAENYHLYMDRLVEFAGDIPVSKITDELVRKYRLWLNRYIDDQGRELSMITQGYHLIALRSFLKYCGQRDIPTLDADRISLPKVQKKQVSFLLAEEVARMFDAIDPDDENSLTSLLTSGTMIAYLPYTSLVRLSGTVSPEVSTFYVSAPQGGTLDQAETAVTDLLMEYCEEDEDAFEVSSQDSLESALSSVTSMMTVMLGGIAGISLVVGGIGIMNIMLVTVTERTREIGIRKAIGASRGTILTQFLMEAVVLCMMGCCLGIFLSWAILQIVNTVVASLDMAFHLNLGVVLISVGFCFVIGLVFGLYPANKAAKMKPIDALHYGG